MYPTLADTLESTAKRFPEKTALVYPRKDQIWTYREFDERVNRLANVLADSGITHGDRVATNLYNGSEIALTAYACGKVGAVFTPLNYRLPAGDLEFILGDSDAAVLLFEGDTREVVEAARPNLDVGEYIYVDDEAPDYASDFHALIAESDPEAPNIVVDESDAYAFIYTSGTTGRPKGVVHEHRDMIEHSLICIAEAGYRRDDVGLSVMPLYHCAELHISLYTRVHLGATSVIHHDFDAGATLSAIGEYDISVLFAAPTGWNALATEYAESPDAYDVSSLRFGLYGAAPMPADVLNRCREFLADEYMQAYGMTEVGPAAIFLYPEDHDRKPDSAGLPGINHDVRIVQPDADPDAEVPNGDVGEILITGPCTMREYWNRPEETAKSLRKADGVEWYYTGDLGVLDDDGYLTVVDRKDDMIISGGENVYPTRIEDVLYSYPGVTDAAVVGEPDETWGERVVAYIVGSATAEALDQHMLDSDDVADFERPREYYFRDSLPTTPSGKVMKFELRE